MVQKKLSQDNKWLLAALRAGNLAEYEKLSDAELKKRIDQKGSTDLQDCLSAENENKLNSSSQGTAAMRTYAEEKLRNISKDVVDGPKKA